MPKQLFIIPIFLVICTSLIGQRMEPSFFLEDQAETHNMHICSDGEYYYTVNGGNAEKGMVNKYDLEGIWIKSYPLRLDVRSIMYNPLDKNLYVAAYDRNIYKLTDMQLGAYEIVLKELYNSKQVVPGLSPGGKQLFVNENGTVKIFDFNDGTLLTTINDIKCGKGFENGSTTIAVDEKYFYTWNSKQKEVFVYDHNGKFLSQIKVAEGGYHFSLSYANNFIFTAFDGESDEGIWYAYSLIDLIGSIPLKPQVEFEDPTETHNTKIAFDGTYYYTVHGGDALKGKINVFNEVGNKVKSYELAYDLNSIMYSTRYKLWYANEYTNKKEKYVYLIDKMKKGKLKPYIKDWYDEPATSITINPSGQHMYVFNDGHLSIYDFKLKQKLDEISGFKCGSEIDNGNAAIAASEKHVFTWNSDLKLVYQYNMKGELVARYQLSKGNYGPSITYTNGMLWVSQDGKGGTGVWYGYDIPNLK